MNECLHFRGPHSRQTTWNETLLEKFPVSGILMVLILQKVTRSAGISRESIQKYESSILLMTRCSVHRSMPRMTSSLSRLRDHSSTGLLLVHTFQKHGNSEGKKKHISIIFVLSC